MGPTRMPYDKIIGLVEHTSRLVEGSAGVSEFYALLGVAARRVRGRDQEGLSEAGDGVPSRTGTPRPRRRPGSRRSPRRTRSCAIRRSARRTTATARPASAAPAAGSASTTWICPKRSTSSCATSAAWAASSRCSAAARARPDDAPGPGRAGDGEAHAGRRGRRRQEDGPASRRSSAAPPARAPAPSRAPSRRTCATCSGSGEVRRAARSMFGQFVSVSPCPTCARRGRRRSASRARSAAARAGCGASGP